MSFGVDVWMSSLVDFQHTQHAYNIHESGIYLKKFNKINIFLSIRNTVGGITKLIVGMRRTDVVTGT